MSYNFFVASGQARAQDHLAAVSIGHSVFAILESPTNFGFCSIRKRCALIEGASPGRPSSAQVGWRWLLIRRCGQRRVISLRLIRTVLVWTMEKEYDQH